MALKRKIKELIYKFIGIIFYFIFSLAGLSILFIFPPKKLLFTDSYEDEVKQELFKNFVKIVYDNINKPLIKEMQYSKENEPCPDGFEELIVDNEYYGKFSKFYGNASFCIQRFDNNLYNYENLLLYSKEKCESGKKPCGKINRYLNDSFFCIDEKERCPLNHLDFLTKPNNETYPTPENKSFLVPFYGRDPNKTVIVNIDIINNERLCLEKFDRNKSLPCEFPDNNHCFIIVGFDWITNAELIDDFKLYTKNIVKWNFNNYDESIYNFCKNNFQFHIFTSNYFNFTYENLIDFKQEFPLSDENNNALYLTYKAYKDKMNIDIFFYLLSCILLIWSLTHFILQILVYFDVKKIRKYYILNGIILFLFKLLCFLGMIIYHFWFYLKIKKVHIQLIDLPLQQLIEVYKQTRIIFIGKMFIFWIIGFIIIVIDLIVLFFTFKIQWGKDIEIKIKKNKIEINNSQNTDIDNNKININRNNFEINYKPNKITNNDINLEDIKINEIKNESLNSQVFYTNTSNKLDNKESKSIEFRENLSLKTDEIILDFVCNNNLLEKYKIKAKKDDNFRDVVNRLKEKNSSLKGKNMKVFSYESKIIDPNETLQQNGITENVKIVIYE